MKRARSPSSRGARTRRRTGPRTLAIDVGGTGLKAAVLDASGRLMSDRFRVPTPARCSPAVLVRALGDLVAPLGAFDRVSVGFPAVVRDGVVRTAPNFASPKWRGFDLARALTRVLKRPVRILNDDEYLGDRARKRVGTRKWNRRVRRVLVILETVVNFDQLYLGGGNAARINFPLGGRVRVVENKAGLLGGIALWR